MLRADVVVLEADRLLTRQRENLPNAIGEVVVHLAESPEKVNMRHR